MAVKKMTLDEIFASFGKTPKATLPAFIDDSSLYFSIKPKEEDMPWKTIKDVPDSVKTHQGAALSLEGANYWAKIYDTVKADPKTKNPAAIAWEIWGRKYIKKDGKWVKPGGEELRKGGPGSGSWNGPDDPRFAWAEKAEGNTNGVGKATHQQEPTASSGVKEKKRGLDTEGRILISDLDDNEKQGVEELVKLQQEVDHLDFEAAQAKEKLKGAIEKNKNLFLEGALKAYDLKDRIVALDTSVKPSISHAKILADLDKYLNDSQKAILGKIREARTSLTTTHTIRFKNKEALYKNLDEALKTPEETIEDLYKAINDWLANLALLEKLVSRLETVAEK